MKASPMLRLKADGFLADTRHLTPSQVGAHVRMLMTASRSPDGSLPDDDHFLAKVTGMGRKQWSRTREILNTFWAKRDGKLVNYGLVEERASESRNSNRARHAATARWLRKRERANADASSKHMVRMDAHAESGGGNRGAHAREATGSHANKLLEELMSLFEIGDRHPLAMQSAEHIRTWLEDGLPGDVIFAICKRIKGRNADGWTPNRWSFFDRALEDQRIKLADGAAFKFDEA